MSEGTIVPESAVANPVDNGSNENSADDEENCLLATAIPYSYFKNMLVVHQVLGATSGRDDVLVIRKEYELVLEAIQEKFKIGVPGVAVTGHPGIGLL